MLRKGRDSTKKVPSVGELCTRIFAHTSRDLFQIERSYISHTWNIVHNLVTFFFGGMLVRFAACVLQREAKTKKVMGVSTVAAILDDGQ